MAHEAGQYASTQFWTAFDAMIRTGLISAADIETAITRFRAAIAPSHPRYDAFRAHADMMERMYRPAVTGSPSASGGL